MMIQTKAKIIENKRVKKNFWHCFFESPEIARSASCGQFVNIKVNDNLEPLLRRPFSIHSVSGKRFAILYEVLGPGSKILSRRKAGDSLDIIGPLGNGFSVKKGPAIIVAGGMGVAPLVFLAEKLVTLRTKSSELRADVLIGARTKEEILCEKKFKDLGFSVTIATDDGSRGFNGRVTDALQCLLRAKSSELRATIYSCGPAPMLKALSTIARKQSIPAQLSLEAHMACGIGACLGCVVNTTQGYKRVCKEGPVFGSEELIWD